MSTMYFTIYLLLLLSIISARPSPRIIYSAVIYNEQNSPVQCNVVWLQPKGDTLQGNTFKILENDSYAVNETIIDMGTWEARAIIDAIQCGDLKLNAPFKGVQGPSVNWKFVVQSDRIRSVRQKFSPSQAN